MQQIQALIPLKKPHKSMTYGANIYLFMINFDRQNMHLQ